MLKEHPLYLPRPRPEPRPYPVVGPDLGALAGRSPAMRTCVTLARDVAQTDLPALILGPSGAGKGVLAEAMHAESPRAHGPFVAVNVAALPPTLFESELFGAEAFAFTDADTLRIGHLERAAEGTLLLDEIGALGLEQQAALLRVLDASAFHRVGGDTPVPMRARILAATSTDLAAKVDAGHFRADLFHRLSVFCLHVPSLGARPEDLDDLALSLAAAAASRLGIPPCALGPAALDALRHHPWPGNVRELDNACTRLTLTASGRTATAEDVARALPPLVSPTTATAHPRTLDQVIADAIADALQVTGGDVADAARRLGISRATVYRWRRATEVRS